MPQPVDATYVIGILREREKYFLGEDEYTRLIGAPSPAAAAHVLAETPYGSGDGLEHVLSDLHDWLSAVLEDRRVVHFLFARYDAFNVATALIRRRLGLGDDPSVLSALGSFSTTALSSAVWHDLSGEMLPRRWRETVRALREREVPAADLVAEVAAVLSAWYEELAFTPLMRDLTGLFAERLAVEGQQRPLAEAREEPSGGVPARLSASVWDAQWDALIMARLQRARREVVGYDPVISYWFAKELEIKTVRVLLSGRSMGLSAAELQYLRRPFYVSVS